MRCSQPGRLLSHNMGCAESCQPRSWPRSRQDCSAGRSTQPGVATSSAMGTFSCRTANPRIRPTRPTAAEISSSGPFGRPLATLVVSCLLGLLGAEMCASLQTASTWLKTMSTGPARTPGQRICTSRRWLRLRLLLLSSVPSQKAGSQPVGFSS